jgi:CRP/FNR family cyclic AMP-dependent transcriptional regulator
MGLDEDLGTLTSIPLFQGLPAEELDQVSRHLHRRTFPAGALIMMVEDPGHAAYLILRGTVKVYVDRVDGTETILALRGPGEIVGEMSLIDRRTRSANVVTIEPCTVLSWDRASFESCLQTMPALTINLLRIVARRLRLASAQIEALAGMDLDGRVARQILAFAEEYGGPAEGGGTVIPLRLTQSDLAALIGASRVRVNGIMVSYQRSGYISVDGQHHITVRNAAALAERCQ